MGRVGCAVPEESVVCVRFGREKQVGAVELIHGKQWAVGRGRQNDSRRCDGLLTG